jgi:FAD:protein FMN transferase
LSTSSACLTEWFERLSCACLAANARAIATEGDDQAVDAAERDGARTPGHDTLLLTISRQAMACEWEVLLNQHQYRVGAELAMQALDLVEQLEGLHSVFRTYSDFSAINRFAASRPVAVSQDTLQLLQLARDLHSMTAGAFDITAGILSSVWGFSRRAGRMPNDREIAKALELVGTPLIEIDEAQQQVSLAKAGVQLNPGGVGKGYALDRAGRKLVSAGVLNFMMHGGLSSVVAQGDRQHQETGGGWLVALKHPWRWEEQLGTIRLRNQALGTSGSGKQFFHYQGERYSHIIDPRTGWPAQGMMSTTVICPSAAVADALATALFVMGVEASRNFLQSHPTLGAVLVYADAKSGSTRLETYNIGANDWFPV